MRSIVSVALLAGLCASAGAQTIILPANPGPANNGGSAGWAIFLDLTAGSQPLNITGFRSGNTGAAGIGFSVEVFTRSGTALSTTPPVVGVGPGSSSAGWTSIGTAAGTQGPVANGISELIDTPDFTVPAGSTIGVAIRFVGVGPRYFGTGSPAYSIFSDANLSLVTGEARSAPFTTTGSAFGSRALVGEVQYSIIPAPGAAALLGLAGLAAARRRR
jgi:hypothetical protein